MQPLALLQQQLWAPALSDDVRVVLDPRPNDEWLDAEAYRVLPRAASARMLLPDGPRAAVIGSLLNYRGLRRRRQNLQRTALGTAVRAGLPLPLPRLVVQVRRSTTSPDLPLAVLAKALGHERLLASIGVRTGANRKATLQLVGVDGQPAGYAKFGWSPTTDEFVSTETRALRDLPRPSKAGMRAPEVLASLDFHGHPVVVTGPLPPDVRGAYDDPGLPSPQEIYSLCPVHRTAPIHETDQFRSLAKRLEANSSALPAELAEAVLDLVSRVARLQEVVPVAQRWHGDLTAWNCARDSTGQLWAWDWESSESDAVAGLDALHWAFSEKRLAVRSLDSIRLSECLQEVAPHLLAAGSTRAAHPAVAAVYVLTVVERAATLAAQNDGWGTVWISPSTLAALVEQAAELLANQV